MPEMKRRGRKRDQILAHRSVTQVKAKAPAVQKRIHPCKLNFGRPATTDPRLIGSEEETQDDAVLWTACEVANAAYGAPQHTISGVDNFVEDIPLSTQAEWPTRRSARRLTRRVV